MTTDTFQVIPNKLADPPLSSDGLVAASRSQYLESEVANLQK